LPANPPQETPVVGGAGHAIFVHAHDPPVHEQVLQPSAAGAVVAFLSQTLPGRTGMGSPGEVTDPPHPNAAQARAAQPSFRRFRRERHDFIGFIDPRMEHAACRTQLLDLAAFRRGTAGTEQTWLPGAGEAGKSKGRSSIVIGMSMGA
jgi:hypothetical protein